MTYYDDLEIPMPESGRWSDVKREDISKSFRRVSLKHHTDKGGSKEDSLRINEAYEVLKNEKSRAEYDRKIQSDLDPVFDPSTLVDGNSLMSSILGAMGIFGREYKSSPAYNSFKTSLFDAASLSAATSAAATAASQLRRDAPPPISARAPHTSTPRMAAGLTSKMAGAAPSPVQSADRSTSKVFVKEQTITLEDLYNCARKPIKITAPQICSDCKGTGGIRKQCVLCKGKGCEFCSCEGFTWDPVCPGCLGEQMRKVTSFVSVKLNPGIDPKIPIDVWGVLPEPETVLRILLKEQKHPLYTRIRPIGVDLHLRLEISLPQSLGGLNYPIRYLDGKEYVFKYDGVIHPGKVLKAKGLGILNKDLVRGNLLIEFVILFPDTLTPDIRSQLMAIAQGASQGASLPPILPAGAVSPSASATADSGPTIVVLEANLK